MNQRDVFVSGEGDAWFRRNRDCLEAMREMPDVEYIVGTLISYKDRINSVVEVGCSSGFKLELLCERFNALGVGIDPSCEAIESGRSRVGTGMELHVGASDDLPCLDGSVDLVYFAFCLYLVDRKLLLRSLAEADRVLSPGGFLVITDFDPGVPHVRSYSHVEGVGSFKQDYASIYISSGLYTMVGKYAFSHSGLFFDEVRDERVSTTILYKEHGYLER